MLRPKILDTLKKYSRTTFQSDLIAGIVVGVVALPLAIAFAIASGVSPEKGLVTAVIAGFLISALGGSRVQIGGPTGAFVVIVYGIIQQYGMEGLMLATIMAGCMLVVFGFARIGSVIKFIPYPVIIGFTSGIAVIIFSSQVKDFLGLSIEQVPSGFFEKWAVLISSMPTANIYSVLIAALTVLMIVVLQKINKRIPGSFLAILFTSMVVYFFNLPVETIGDRFGAITHSLALTPVPAIDMGVLRNLIRPAFTIAMLAGIESLLSAIVADGMVGGKHRSNMELVAQGVANIVVPFFGGIPATGAIARTATNIHNGGRTPVSGIVHALTLLFILLFFGKAAALIPLSALAGILVVVSYRMAEWHSFKMVLRAPKSDALVLLMSFLLTIIFDLTVAIEVGVMLAFLLFIRRVSLTKSINEVQGYYVDEEERDDPDSVSEKVIPDGAEVYEINGPFFFGVASTFTETMGQVEKNPVVRILRMRHVSSVDATAINALRRVIEESFKYGITIVLSGLQDSVNDQLVKSGITQLVGRENVTLNIDTALKRAELVLAANNKKQGRSKKDRSC